MKRLLLLMCLTIGNTILFAQSGLLQSGPMLGYSEMREVQLWVQTTSAAEVQFAYWLPARPDSVLLTEKITTSKTDAYVAKVVADQVEPGTTYAYQLLLNNQPVHLPYPTQFQTQELWQWRKDPPAFKLAVGSCFYINEPIYDRPGKPYGGQYHIMKNLYKHQPDLMLWLGDNTYLREADWYSQTGILHRYTHTRSMKELQPLLASTHHYAIWDDHDFGPNDADRSFIHKEKTLDAFELFWGNPTTGIPQQQGGITTFFQWADIDFFLLDNRYFRTPNYRKTGERTMLGEEQLEWLIDALAQSRAPFKMVAIGGQVLNTAEVAETYSRLFPEEREWLLQRIEEEGIRNVIFLTGDRHHSELSTYTNKAGYAVYDLTVSSLTAGPHLAEDEVNELRVEGTLLGERNFGILEFSGPRTERNLKISLYNAEGVQKWTQTLKQQK